MGRLQIKSPTADLNIGELPGFGSFDFFGAKSTTLIYDCGLDLC